MRTDPQRGEAIAQSRRRFLRLSAAGVATGFAGAILRTAEADTRLAARNAEAPTTHIVQPALRKAAKGLEELSKVKDYQATLLASGTGGDIARQLPHGTETAT